MSTTTKKKSASAKKRIPKKASVKRNSPAKAAQKRVKVVDYVPTEAEIRARAYEIYQRRGGDHGRDVDDWLQAEKELSQK